MVAIVDNSNKPENKALDDFRAENMAYASQSAFINVAANIYEPFLNTWIQKRYAQSHPEHYNRPAHERYGNWKQNVVGELAGDVGGSATLFLASSFAPNITQGFINATGRMVHPIFHTLGHAAFKDEFNEPYYAQKVNKWADFQEKNFARSLIVAAGNIVTNTLTQKHVMKNPSPTKVIAGGKLLTTSITNSGMLLARFVAPQKMKDMDERMGKKYFSEDDEKEFKRAEITKAEESQQPQQQRRFAQYAPPRFTSHVDRLRYNENIGQSHPMEFMLR